MQVQVEWDVVRRTDGVIGRVTVKEGAKELELCSVPLPLYAAKDWARSVKALFDDGRTNS